MQYYIIILYGTHGKHLAAKKENWNVKIPISESICQCAVDIVLPLSGSLGFENMKKKKCFLFVGLITRGGGAGMEQIQKNYRN